MTDIDEAIARWMGWQPMGSVSGKPEWIRPDQADMDWPLTTKNVPRYTASLDEQVPVWEALRGGGGEFHIVCAGDTNTAWFDDDYENRVYGTTPAEAAAQAIHAALVAMGEVDA